MPDSLENLVADRLRLLQEISQLGDFRPGSITAASRRCGKPTCHCARPKDPGHGPHVQLTYKHHGKTVSETLPTTADQRKAAGEIAGFRRFRQLSQALIEVNEKICRLRPIGGSEAAERSPEEKKRPKRSAARSSRK